MSTAVSSGIQRFRILPRQDRGLIYDAMNEGLAKLHAIDVAAVGLSDYGKPGSYFARQLQRWSEQYRASETARIEDMDRLIVWLGQRVPADDGRVALVHGDWRIDNMIFDAHAPRLIAVLDWELSTLGHPFADLAYQCMHWRLPHTEFNGLGGIDRATQGIPTEAEYVAAYCRRAGLERIPDWTFLIAFSFFRYAAIAQGVYKRSLDGNASNPERARHYRPGGSVDGAACDGGDRNRAPDGRDRPCEQPRAMLSGAPTSGRHVNSSTAPERWQSGRSRRTRNAEYVQAYRGFESLPLRHGLMIDIAV